MKEIELSELKRRYDALRKKHGLPEFSKINEEFEIEKVQERETEFLLREIRRAMSEKIAAFLRFFELFLNPQAAPVFILGMLKSLTVKDKELIEHIYNQLVNFELTSITLDIIYDEKKEVDFIKNTFKKWQCIKEELQEFSRIIERAKLEEKERKRKSYFG
ncbi:MAG: hypothetical protein K6T16_02175 [Candidatus Pacearchaeota archaeon]|nr:hypothetical protein [Candidatus Pacearchaeota archaeon]